MSERKQYSRKHKNSGVYVGRAKGARGRWGNPYVVGIHGTAEECVQQFEARYREDAAHQAAVRLHLRGKDLRCWCPEGTPCHGDVLLRWANRPA